MLFPGTSVRNSFAREFNDRRLFKIYSVSDEVRLKREPSWNSIGDTFRVAILNKDTSK